MASETAERSSEINAGRRGERRRKRMLWTEGVETEDRKDQ